MCVYVGGGEGGRGRELTLEKLKGRSTFTGSGFQLHLLSLAILSEQQLVINGLHYIS